MPVTQPTPTPLTTAGRLWIFGREGVQWGTAAATGLIQEPIVSVDPATQRDTVDDTGHAGVAADLLGIDEATHYEQITVRVDSRPNGFASYMCAGMMGPATYTPTGPSPYTHIIKPTLTSNLLNTWSGWYKSSLEGTTTKQYLAMTPTSAHFTFAQNADLSCEVQLWSKFAANATAPTPNVIIGQTVSNGTTPAATDPTRLMSTGGTFTLVGSSGSAYTTRVLSGDFDIARTLEVCQDSTQRDIFYIKAGNLTFTGNLVLVFEGYGAGTVEQDFRTFSAGGTVGTPNVLQWTSPLDGTYMKWTFWPMKLTAFTLDHTGQYIKANISFRAYPNPPEAFAASGPQLSVVQYSCTNGVASAMVAP